MYFFIYIKRSDAETTADSHFKGTRDNCLVILSFAARRHGPEVSA